MTKQEVIADVAKRRGATKKDTELFLIALGETLTSALAAGETVRFIGFGAFEPRSRAARQGRDPRTGEALTIPAGKTVVFRCGKNLKEALR